MNSFGKVIASKIEEKKLAKTKKSTNGSGSAWQKFLVMLQELGKALQFPVAVLPFAAILNRFGALGLQYAEEHSVGWWISTIIQKPGDIPFSNLPLFFAIGIAFGLAKDHRGEVTMVGVILYMAVAALTAENTLPELLYGKVLTFKDWDGKEYSSLLYVQQTLDDGITVTGGTYVLNTGVLGGIVAGSFAAFFYNRLKEIKLPTALSFFGGRRFVPMVGLAFAIPLAFAFALIWPWIQFGLMAFGSAVADPTNPALAIPGTAIYGILNRLLLAFGLHQIMNTFFWFQMPIQGEVIAPMTGLVEAGGPIWVNGDINAFTAGLSTSGLFQAGFFPIMMGGLPMAAIAMIMTADKGNRKEMAGFLGGVAAVSFLSGITEPLEFSFIFIAPVLLGVHALLTGVFVGITTAMQIQIGFGFSAGFIDYAISFAQSWGLSKHAGTVMSNPLWILVLTAAAGAVYYFVFYFSIKKFNLATPGRSAGDDKAITPVNSDASPKGKASKESKSSKSEKYENMAKTIVETIGKDNFVTVDNCATRLRLVVKDNSTFEDAPIKAAGTYGVKRLGTEGVQIVVGPDVEHVANSLKKQLNM